MTKKHFIWADLLKINATLLVVVLHSSGNLNNYSLDPYNWWVSNFYASFSHPCIALFVMLSGTFLLDKQEDIKTFFLKRIDKVLIPLIIWSIIYLLFFHFYEGKKITLSVVAKGLVSPSISYHLWFLFMILGIYLMVPIVSKWVQIASRRDLEYFLILWFLIACFKPFFSKLLNFYIYIPIEAASGYLGCFILGYYLKDYKPASKTLLYILFIIAFSITAGGTFYQKVFKTKPAFDELFYAFLSPNIIIMAVVIYVSFKSLNTDSLSIKAVKVIQKISACCFGVYLIHIIVLIIIKNYIKNTVQLNSLPLILTIPLIVLICFIISLVLTYIIKKIPVLRKTAP
jgi:surface polysaccharide O-acyltransferase-like enzyme